MQSRVPTRLFGLLLVTISIVGGSSSVDARTISWGNAVDDTNIQSGGSPITATFSIRLGGFADGFDPATESLSLWELNWDTFDTASYNATSSFFSSSNQLEDNDVFDSTDVAYMWIQEGNEWALITNPGWVFGVGIPDDNSDPANWRISEAGTAAVLGAVNDTTFDIQTVLVAIPEPSVGLLAVLGAFLLVGSRGSREKR